MIVVQFRPRLCQIGSFDRVSQSKQELAILAGLTWMETRLISQAHITRYEPWSVSNPKVVLLATGRGCAR